MGIGWVLVVGEAFGVFLCDLTALRNGHIHHGLGGLRKIACSMGMGMSVGVWCWKKPVQGSGKKEEV